LIQESLRDDAIRTPLKVNRPALADAKQRNSTSLKRAERVDFAEPVPTDARPLASLLPRDPPN
jgi:hypothetical protein